MPNTNSQFWSSVQNLLYLLTEIPLFQNQDFKVKRTWRKILLMSNQVKWWTIPLSFQPWFPVAKPWEKKDHSWALIQSAYTILRLLQPKVQSLSSIFLMQSSSKEHYKHVGGFTVTTTLILVQIFCVRCISHCYKQRVKEVSSSP